MTQTCTCTIDSDDHFVGGECYWNDHKSIAHIVSATRRIDAERQAVPTDAPTGAEIMEGYKAWADRLDPRAAAGILSGFRAGVHWLLHRGLPAPEPGPLLVADCGCELWADGLVQCHIAANWDAHGPTVEYLEHLTHALNLHLRPSSYPPELLRWAAALGTTPEVLLEPGVCNYVGEARAYLHRWVDGAMQVTATLTETP